MITVNGTKTSSENQKDEKYGAIHNYFINFHNNEKRMSYAEILHEEPKTLQKTTLSLVKETGPTDTLPGDLGKTRKTGGCSEFH